MTCLDTSVASGRLASAPTVAFLVTALLSGCGASFRGEPDPTIQEGRDIVAAGINHELSDALIRDALDKPTETKRNRVVLARLTEIDQLYAAFEIEISREIRKSGFATTLAELAVDGAGALVSGGTSQVLSAISAGITGASEAFSKEILVDRTIQALTAQMRANRLQVERRIRERLSDPLSKYPLLDALGDLVDYRHAGTITAALLGVARNASNEEELAKGLLDKAVDSARFSRDKSGDDLREFWKPDGVNVDPDNQAQIRDWMNRNGLTGESITFFFRADEHADQRLRAARELLR